jgi:general secretion pathway protein C
MGIAKLLHRWFALIIPALVAVAALLNAQGIEHVVAAQLRPDARQLAAASLVARPQSAMASASLHTTSADPILARNPFDSVTGPLGLPATRVGFPTDAPMVGVADPSSAPDCDGVRVLVIAASSDPDWSFAALEASATNGKSILRRRGGDVAGKTVRFVGWDRVWMVSPEGLCQAPLFKSPLAASASGVVLAQGPAPSDTPALLDDIKKRVRRVGPTEIAIDRAAVDEILDKQALLMGQVRIVPEQENGSVVGIRLFGVRPDSLLGILGIENGDRLQKINGFDMTSPQQALQAYARLRDADHLTVNLNRREKETNIDIDIR